MQASFVINELKR